MDLVRQNPKEVTVICMGPLTVLARALDRDPELPMLMHRLICLGGAWLLRVDVHSAAIASAANVGGAASAPVVAAAHRESLVPASILMALIGYAIGNYCALVTARLCHWVGGG